MKCMYCKGKMVKGTAPFDVARQGYRIHWDAVEAWVCIQCGEAYFETDAVARIQQALRILEKETESIMRSPFASEIVE